MTPLQRLAEQQEMIFDRLWTAKLNGHHNYVAHLLKIISRISREMVAAFNEKHS